MALWKQALLSLAVLGVALVLWVGFVPAALPVLARIGVLEPLVRLGIAVPAPEAAGQGAAAGAGARGPGGPGGAAVAVVAAPPAPQVMNDIISAIGSARAVRSVTLLPEVSGQIVALAVTSGDYVEAGALVAELNSDAARIALDRAELMLADARATSARQAQLQARGATTELALRDAELALKTAELALRQAEFDLAQHRITAPVSGWVGILAVEAGDQIGPSVEITRIEDRSSLIVDFRVPERVVSLLKLGDPVSAEPLAQPGVRLEGAISALDNRVDETSRSLRVQAALGNADDSLRSGMAFAITLEFAGESLPAVDPLSIQWGAEGAFVWLVREGKAARLPVRIVQRNSDAVLIRADLLPGDLVVVEGVQALRPGVDVTVAGAPDPAPKT
ncbi:efflux RND transporter periplasmic adaptor subunit [Paracoccaceae bacterium Fryx2]|nr:efflux RND transporter periplasmic adaptor subunit [Paracoccaceae bacterium Fryx2]